jgi:hypothetical protein
VLAGHPFEIESLIDRRSAQPSASAALTICENEDCTSTFAQLTASKPLTLISPTDIFDVFFSVTSIRFSQPGDSASVNVVELEAFLTQDVSDTDGDGVPDDRL